MRSSKRLISGVLSAILCLGGVSAGNNQSLTTEEGAFAVIGTIVVGGGIVSAICNKDRIRRNFAFRKLRDKVLSNIKLDLIEVKEFGMCEKDDVSAICKFCFVYSSESEKSFTFSLDVNGESKLEFCVLREKVVEMLRLSISDLQSGPNCDLVLEDLAGFVISYCNIFSQLGSKGVKLVGIFS